MRYLLIIIGLFITMPGDTVVYNKYRADTITIRSYEIVHNIKTSQQDMDTIKVLLKDLLKTINDTIK